MTRATFDRISRTRMRNAMWTRACHLEDLTDRRSLREAFQLVRRAVRLGLREAQGSFASAYDRPDSVRPSRRMAVHWYRKAWRSGSAIAARNLGVTMQAEGRRGSAILWFRRAIAAGDPDARLDLAKLLLQDQTTSHEAQRLLKEYIEAGPQEIFELRPIGNLPRVNKNVRLEDEDFNEAKLLLASVKDGVNA